MCSQNNIVQANFKGGAFAPRLDSNCLFLSRGRFYKDPRITSLSQRREELADACLRH